MAVDDGDVSSGYVKADVPVIFARVGEKLTCENGHEVAIVLKPLTQGQSPLETDFSSWNAKFTEQRCSCNAAFRRYDVVKSTYEYHFSDGWRSALPREQWSPDYPTATEVLICYKPLTATQLAQFKELCAKLSKNVRSNIRR